MSLYTKLNKWQRIGIALSIAWAFIVGIHTYNQDIESAKKSAEFSYEICVESKETNHNNDLSSCELERTKDFALYSNGHTRNAIFVALAPIPFGWLCAFILFYAVKAQIIGFRAVVPWKRLNTYKKSFVILCIVFSVIVMLFYLIGELNSDVDIKVPVALSSDHSVIKMGDGFVLAEGTWTRTDLTNDSIMNPLQTTKIECIKQDNRCYEATASVSGNLLISDISVHDVDSWSKDSIIYHDNALCASTLYTIDLNTQVVSGAGHNINDNLPTCKGPLSSPTDPNHWGLLLTDGLKVYWSLRQQARPYLLKVIQSWFGN